MERRCLDLAAAFHQGAEDRGFALVPEDAATQILGIRISDPKGVRERLLARKVIAAVRGGLLRVGFHAYNDESDVVAALDALGSV